MRSALIQLMAAAEAKRDVLYFTFKDSQFVDNLCQIHEFIRDVQLAVGQYHCTVATNLENSEYSGISVDVENSWNSQGILSNFREKLQQIK